MLGDELVSRQPARMQRRTSAKYQCPKWQNLKAFLHRKPRPAKSVPKRGLRGAPDRRNVTMRIVEATSFDRSRSYRLDATAIIGSPRCGRDVRYGKLCFAAERCPALAILWPFDL